MSAARDMPVRPMDPRAHFEARLGVHVIPILPGNHAISTDPGLGLMTLLGSCVAACIRDRRTGIGGLNHFLLPSGGEADALSARYGVHAMEVLINDILGTGAAKRDLEAKLFGGGNIIGSRAAISVGAKNAAFARSYLVDEGIALTAEDLGGDRARRVYFIPATGKVHVQRIRGDAAAETRARELALTRKAPPKSGGVELF
ncbi:MAG: chemoreceptor glutamine deamidase CheD [Pseudomonadota bacterium]